MLDRTEQKRHRQHIHCRDHGPDQCNVGTVEVDGADPGLLEGFLFLAELARVEHLDLVAAAGALRDQAAHVEQRLHGWVFLVLGIGRTKFARESARCGGRQKQRDNKRYGPRKVGAAVHGQQIPFG